MTPPCVRGCAAGITAGGTLAAPSAPFAGSGVSGVPDLALLSTASNARPGVPANARPFVAHSISTDENVCGLPRRSASALIAE